MSPSNQLPAVSPVARRRRGGPLLETIDVALKTSTPLLGGGVIPREVDRVTPVRVASIRGGLRMWWRALHVHECAGDGAAGAAALAAREAELWGAMGRGDEEPRRSAVEVWVTDVTDVDADLDRWIDNSDVKPGDEGAYALWPAREEKRNHRPPAERWRSGLRFRLHVRAPSGLMSEITRTIRVWLLFGGLGSRTRRGVGSLTLAGMRGDESGAVDARSWLPESLTAAECARLLGPIALTGPASDGIGKACETPGLHGATLMFGKPGKSDDAAGAWRRALGWLYDFRQRPAPKGAQGRDSERYAREGPPRHVPGNGRSKYRAGRSNWPESDKIRALSGRNRRWAHEIRHTAQAPAWPRAGFGLPLPGQFQRNDRRTDKPYQHKDPDPFEITWRDADGDLRSRLASPLIVKALPLADGRFAPIALWLHRAYPDGVVGMVDKRSRGRKRLVRGSEAPFDRLHAPGDSVLYTPLAADSLRAAFCDWLLAKSDVERIDS